MKKISSFSQFLKEEKGTVYFTFGRMNPPTIGHEKLIDALAEKAGSNPYRVYLSHSQDTKKNPLLYEDKLKFSRKAFPRHGRSIMNDNGVRNILEAASRLYEDGFKNIVMVCGQDRLSEFRERLNRYNGKDGQHGFYIFENIKVVSGGERDPDSLNIDGVSSSKLRESVKTSDFITFSQGLPKNVTTEDAKKLYNRVRVGLGLNEEKKFRAQLKLGKKSHLREQYITGELFGVGDTVVIKESDEVGSVVVLGANYVIVEKHDGTRVRKWIHDVETLN